MNLKTARYISDYYHHFFNETEMIAHRHLISIAKLEGQSEASPLYKVYKRKGWLTANKEVFELVKNGADCFFINTANRILSENKSNIFLNYCPNCQKLARTPKARQCRHCEKKWFENENV